MFWTSFATWDPPGECQEDAVQERCRMTSSERASPAGFFFCPGGILERGRGETNDSLPFEAVALACFTDRPAPGESPAPLAKRPRARDRAGTARSEARRRLRCKAVSQDPREGRSSHQCSGGHASCRPRRYRCRVTCEWRD